MAPFDIKEFLDTDPRSVTPGQLSQDLFRLGNPLMQAVGYTKDEQGLWTGQDTFNAPTDGEDKFYFIANDDNMLTTILTRPGLTRAAFLPTDESAFSDGLEPNIRIETGDKTDYYTIPLGADVDQIGVTQVCTTVQELAGQSIRFYKNLGLI